MKFERLSIPDIILIEPHAFTDDRGAFFETFSEASFKETTGFTGNFVQDNHSISHKGVLRGMHYQLPPHAQGKLVRVTNGAVYDVAVDIRRSSPTFGKWIGAILSAENRKMLWIPPGFAHGFLTLTDNADFIYKVTNYYNAEASREIAWNDPGISITWPLQEIGISNPVLAKKDAVAPLMEKAVLFD